MSKSEIKINTWFEPTLAHSKLLYLTSYNTKLFSLAKAHIKKNTFMCNHRYPSAAQYIIISFYIGGHGILLNNLFKRVTTTAIKINDAYVSNFKARIKIWSVAMAICKACTADNKCHDLYVMFDANNVKMARKPGKKRKEYPVGCTGEGKRWKINKRRVPRK